MRRRCAGFTLIELLVVIAIIAILAAILFPVFARARSKAQQNTCLSNTKELALAANMYVSDYDNMCFFGSYYDASSALVSWPCELFPYVKNNQIFVCPSDINQRTEDPNGHPTAANTPAPVSYCMNGITTSNWGSCSGSMTGYNGGVPMSMEKVDDTARTILFYDYNDQLAGSRVEAYNYQAYQVDLQVPGKTMPTTTQSWTASHHAGGYNTAYMDGHSKWVMWGSSTTQMWAINYIPGGGC